MEKKESKKSERQEDTKFKSFVNFLKEEKFRIQKDNPNHRPGEGYDPPRFIEWDIDHVVECFINRFEQKLEDKTEKIKKIFNIANKALIELGYASILKAFELRKLAWVNGNNVIEILTNHDCSEIHVDIKKP